MLCIFASGAQTADPIGTIRHVETAERDGTDLGAIGAEWRVPRATVQALTKINPEGLQTKPMGGRGSNLVGRWPPLGGY